MKRFVGMLNSKCLRDTFIKHRSKCICVDTFLALIELRLFKSVDRMYGGQDMPYLLLMKNTLFLLGLEIHPGDV